MILQRIKEPIKAEMTQILGLADKDFKLAVMD